MGTKKKKAEKKKDFQKRKLRVGKTSARPDNYTDTSFSAKSISLPNQTIAKHKTGSGQLKDPNGDVDLSHYLQLAKHHLASTRKEVLAFIEAHLPSNSASYKQILTQTLSLLTDECGSVRRAFVSLLSACADRQPGFLQLHMRSIILFIHSAMSHIRSEVRASSTQALNVLVTKAANALVTGFLVKTLRSFFSLLSWTLTDDTKAVSLAVNTTASLGGVSKKTRAYHIAVLTRLLDAALFADNSDSASMDWTKCSAIHPQTRQFMLPLNPQEFAQLKLFVNELPNQETSGAVLSDIYSLADINAVSTEDIETRRKIVKDVFLKPLRRNISVAARDGGEVGLEANKCILILDRFDNELKAEAMERVV